MLFSGQLFLIKELSIIQWYFPVILQYMIYIIKRVFRLMSDERKRIRHALNSAVLEQLSPGLKGEIILYENTF